MGLVIRYRSEAVAVIFSFNKRTLRCRHFLIQNRALPVQTLCLQQSHLKNIKIKKTNTPFERFNACFDKESFSCKRVQSNTYSIRAKPIFNAKANMTQTRQNRKTNPAT
jgi:hypothetical protein